MGIILNHALLDLTGWSGLIGYEVCLYFANQSRLGNSRKAIIIKEQFSLALKEILALNKNAEKLKLKILSITR
jgi:hypothetical protein